MIFRSFNTTGGELDDEQATAAMELLLAKGGQWSYKARLKELLPMTEKHFEELGWLAARACPTWIRTSKAPYFYPVELCAALIG